MAPHDSLFSLRSTHGRVVHHAVVPRAWQSWYVPAALALDAVAAAAGFAVALAVLPPAAPGLLHVAEIVVFAVLWTALVALNHGYDARLLGAGPDEFRIIMRTAIAAFALAGVVVAHARLRRRRPPRRHRDRSHGAPRRRRPLRPAPAAAPAARVGALGPARPRRRPRRRGVAAGRPAQPGHLARARRGRRVPVVQPRRPHREGGRRSRRGRGGRRHGRRPSSASRRRRDRQPPRLLGHAAASARLGARRPGRRAGPRPRGDRGRRSAHLRASRCGPLAAPGRAACGLAQQPRGQAHLRPGARWVRAADRGHPDADHRGAGPHDLPRSGAVPPGARRRGRPCTSAC